MRSSAVPLTRLVLLSTFIPAAMLAQTAQITGRVTDASGAVIAAAKVAVTNINTGVRREHTS